MYYLNYVLIVTRINIFFLKMGKLQGGAGNMIYYLRIFICIKIQNVPYFTET